MGENNMVPIATKNSNMDNSATLEYNVLAITRRAREYLDDKHGEKFSTKYFHVERS